MEEGVEEQGEVGVGGCERGGAGGGGVEGGQGDHCACHILADLFWIYDFLHFFWQELNHWTRLCPNINSSRNYVYKTRIGKDYFQTKLNFSGKYFNRTEIRTLTHLKYLCQEYLFYM